MDAISQKVKTAHDETDVFQNCKNVRLERSCKLTQNIHAEIYKSMGMMSVKWL